MDQRETVDGYNATAALCSLMQEYAREAWNCMDTSTEWTKSYVTEDMIWNRGVFGPPAAKYKVAEKTKQKTGKQLSEEPQRINEEKKVKNHLAMTSSKVLFGLA